MSTQPARRRPPRGCPPFERVPSGLRDPRGTRDAQTPSFPVWSDFRQRFEHPDAKAFRDFFEHGVSDRPRFPSLVLGPMSKGTRIDVGGDA